MRTLNGTLARLSLRSRLLLISLALLSTGLLISDLVVVGTLRGHLVDRVDYQLRALAAIVSRLPANLLSGPAGTSAPPGVGLPAMTAGLDLISQVHIELLDPDGSVGQTYQVPSGGPGPRLPRLDTAAVAARQEQAFGVPGTGGADGWRVVAEPRAANLASNAGAPEGSVVVAASLSTVDGTVGRTRNICLLTGAAVLLLLAAAGWFAVRGGLRPLRRIEETATVIAGGVGRTDPPGGDLSRRVSAGAGTRTEIGRLSAALDGMLGQLEAAFAAQAASEARMRRFVGDVSHELRTPLFGIRGFAELYQMGGLPDRGDVDRTMTRIEREADRLAHLVEDLLLLARLDEPAGAGALPLHLAPMDLRTLAADAREDLRALDPSRPVELTGPAPSPTARPALIAGPGAVYGMPLPAGELDGPGPPGRAPVLGDEARLRQAVANLVGNAIAHTPAGSPVRIGVGTVGGDAVLEVTDRGPGLDPEQAARVFDRFCRVDSSRSRDTGGAGLGLSIAQSLAWAHGGRVELTSAPGRGATFRVVIPATPD